MLFDALGEGGGGPALRFPERELDYEGLRGAALALAPRLSGAGRVAVWAQPRLETCVAVVAGLLAGTAVVPLNPRSGARELEHIVADSTPELLLAAADEGLPDVLAPLPRAVVDAEARANGRALPS